VSGPFGVCIEGSRETWERVVEADDLVTKIGKEADVCAGSAAEIEDSGGGLGNSPPKQFGKQSEPTPEAAD